MKKTLGGDRLGSGKKMQVELHGYERSTHDKSYIWRSTMSAGTLVPFIHELALPGDTWDINLDCDMKTHPTVGPLFGSYKVQLDTFVCPIRLYQGLLHNNKLGIGMDMANVYLPQILLKGRRFTGGYNPSDIDNEQINPSSIMAYLGVRGVGRVLGPDEFVERSFNAVKLLAYWDIYKNYYANKQEEIGAVIHNPPPSAPRTINDIEVNTNNLPNYPATAAEVIGSGSTMEISYSGIRPNTDYVTFRTVNRGDRLPISTYWTEISDVGSVITLQYKHAEYGDDVAINWTYTEGALDLPVSVATFELERLDQMREAILAHTGTAGAFEVNSQAYPPYEWIYEDNNDALKSSQEGLAIKAYQSDLFNNWMKTEWIDGPTGINAITAIDTTTGSINVDTILLSRKVYDMLNRIAISGGTYDDWIDAVYAHDRYQRCESPMYMGGLIKELVFQEVVSNSESGSESEDGSQPLGTLAGRGVLGKKHKGGQVTIKVDEPSYIIGIISLTPRVDYSQGNKWDTHLETMDDLHKPPMDQIGFQDLITEQMAWWDTEWDGTEWVQMSAGKQPAWLNYMTNVNVVLGNFAIESNEMFMTLNRRYTPNTSDWSIEDVTTYIDPAKYNHIFADTSRDSQNFWAQIAVDITYRGKISAKVMPNL